ncbi:MAG TPA: fumarylacetoacetate hydrolase family protein, partial [Acidimicrobiales bacterium]|nr:fumarylacetoacetate hydrolase family protein [Acidimicrobiales bacterium]
MRLVTTTRGVGVLDGDAVRLLDTKYADIGEALSAGLDPEALAGSPVLDEVPLEAVTLRPPVLRPSKIWGVGYAYADHRREVGFGETPTHPMVFLKAPSSVIACNESIVLPLVAPDRVDYEGELGVVIGRRASSVARADAAAFVAGYTVVNDVTARDIQRGDIPGRKGDTSMAK